jgi:hypothetical protein
VSRVCYCAPGGGDFATIKGYLHFEKKFPMKFTFEFCFKLKYNKLMRKAYLPAPG